MNNKHKLAWVAGVMSLLVVLGLVSVTLASPSFWETVAKEAGHTLGLQLSQQVGPAVVQAPEQSHAIAGVNTYASPQIAQMSLDTTTSTQISLTNNDGVDRIIQQIDLFTNYATGTISGGKEAAGAHNLVIATSTSASATSTNFVGLAVFAITSSTSASVLNTTSTFTVVDNRVWHSGETIVGKWAEGSAANATSTGFISVKYWSK